VKALAEEVRRGSVTDAALKKRLADLAKHVESSKNASSTKNDALARDVKALAEEVRRGSVTDAALKKRLADLAKHAGSSKNDLLLVKKRLADLTKHVYEHDAKYSQNCCAQTEELKTRFDEHLKGPLHTMEAVLLHALATKPDNLHRLRVAAESSGILSAIREYGRHRGDLMDRMTDVAVEVLRNDELGLRKHIRDAGSETDPPDGNMALRILNSSIRNSPVARDKLMKLNMLGSVFGMQDFHPPGAATTQIVTDYMNGDSVDDTQAAAAAAMETAIQNYRLVYMFQLSELNDPSGLVDPGTPWYMSYDDATHTTQMYELVRDPVTTKYRWKPTGPRRKSEHAPFLEANPNYAVTDFANSGIGLAGGKIKEWEIRVTGPWEKTNSHAGKYDLSERAYLKDAEKFHNTKSDITITTTRPVSPRPLSSVSMKESFSRIPLYR
jgi:ribosomal protein S15P/S13E